MPQMRFRPELRPGPTGKLTTLPRPLIGCVGGTLPRPYPTHHLRRFDRRALGASHLCPTQAGAPAALGLATACSVLRFPGVWTQYVIHVFLAAYIRQYLCIFISIKFAVDI